MITGISDDTTFVQLKSAQWVYQGKTKQNKNNSSSSSKSLESEDKRVNSRTPFPSLSFPTWLQRSHENIDIDGDLEPFSQVGDYFLDKFF